MNTLFKHELADMYLTAEIDALVGETLASLLMQRKWNHL